MTSTVENSRAGTYAKHHVAPREFAFTKGTDDYLRFAVFYPTFPAGMGGQNPGDAVVNPNILDLQNHIDLAQTAEEIGIDYLFMAEGYDPGSDLQREASINSPWLFNPVLASMLVPVTKRIGLVTTMHFSHIPAILIARLGANLDALSGGRWGLNIVTGPGGAQGLMPESTRALSHDERYEYAMEAMDVILELWRGERVEHKGRFLELSGRLIDPLPIQQPPGVVTAGMSPAGLNLAAKYTDYLFQNVETAEQARTARAGLADMLAKYGRKPRDLKAQGRARVYVRDTQAEVDQFQEELESYFDPRIALGPTYQTDGADQERIKQERAGLSEQELRTLLIEEQRQRMAAGDLNLRGTPDAVARRIIDVYRDGICQSIALVLQDWHADSLREFGKVLPLLREEGIWVHPRERGYSW